MKGDEDEENERDYEKDLAKSLVLHQATANREETHQRRPSSRHPLLQDDVHCLEEKTTVYPCG